MHAIDQPLSAIRKLLDGGTVTSLDLAEECISRTRANADINAWTCFDADALREEAKQADRRLSAGERLPLLGIPIALKDNIEAAGMTCGAGTGALHGKAPNADAELVARLRAAGALIAGKVGMHELAFGITTNNAVTGAVRNPWDHARIPGGSSGGSGAVVGARFVPAAIGTDTGGSVRVPAALCGVSGFRPTVGRVSGQGIAPISVTRDTAGPLAYTIADCALLDAVLTGAQDGDSKVELKGLRLGVPRDPFWSDLEAESKRVAEAALEGLRQAGVELVDVELPALGELNASVSFPVALYEFVRDMRAYLDARDRGVTLEEVIAAVGSPDVRGAVGTLLTGGGIPEDVYKSALEARKRMQALYAQTFASQRIEALVFPTTPRTAALIGEDETVELNGAQHPTFGTFIRNTDPGSNASLPGVTLPIGLAHGLPVGLALDGPLHSDRRLLAIAEAVQSALPPAPRLETSY
ncbi:indoleacetamide hydrolase [Variovorax sp. KK3]|uniref:indoleacetamide hydrolase n=1 Tax=Variovorax sp. KK3 TaxID=1855728 RepID=UPI00097C0E45|nr:indoleacetamide hydrolase [Variovorax sp. KK3]